MGQLVSFIQQHHLSTSRNYLARGADPHKAHKAQIASRFEFDYWDGDRSLGYGGYHYDGRWRSVAQNLIDHYDINAQSSVLDIGCGKGFLLYELKCLVPELTIHGVDISAYAVENSKPEIKDSLIVASAQALPFADNSVDLIISNMTLHNLKLPALFQAFREIERVKTKYSWVCIESYRSMQEKINMLNWQLTCNAFFDVEEWQWIFQQTNYTGDYEFGFFE